MRELQALQLILARTLLKAGEQQRRIRSLHLALGEISELDRDLIQVHWDAISRGTPAEGAQLRFHLIPAEVQCMACFARYHPLGGQIHCPFCGSYGAKVLSGEEFFLERIELDDE